MVNGGESAKKFDFCPLVFGPDFASDFPFSVFDGLN